MDLKEIGEFALIDRIKSIVDPAGADLVVGLGDDAAAFKTTGDRLILVATDALVEGVHFDLSYFSFHQLGWRALAVNLSDIAAMGGLPNYAVVSIALPAKTPSESVEEFYRGAKQVGDEFHTLIIGGDTTQSPDKIFISVTMMGEVATEKLTRRSRAKVGDAIFVTGALGGAKAGLGVLKSGNKKLKAEYRTLIEKHLMPEPKVAEGRFLVKNFPIHAMIDISDGLASDVHHICRQSGVGATLCEAKIPIDSATVAVAEILKQKPCDYALRGGEDFELLFTLPADFAEPLQDKFCKQVGYDCHRIGTLTGKAGSVVLELTDGTLEQIHADQGYHHFSVP